jgi:nitrogen permease regulator 2-like protein
VTKVLTCRPQGFLRRVHRWPVLLNNDKFTTDTKPSTTTLPPSPVLGSRKRATSLTVVAPGPLATSSSISTSPVRPRRRTSEASLAFAAVSTHSTSGTVSLPPRAAEASLGTLRLRATGPPSPRTIRASREPRRHSTTTAASLFEITQALGTPTAEPRLQHVVARPRLSRSPSTPAVKTQTNGAAAAPSVPVVISQPLGYPPALVPLLDGEHHTDELCCRFEVGWPTLERWLTAVGEGSGDGDFGKVLMIYR